MRLFLYGLLRSILAVNINANPGTGDPNAGIMWVIIGALVVSAILIVVLVVMGRKGKKK